MATNKYVVKHSNEILWVKALTKFIYMIWNSRMNSGSLTANSKPKLNSQIDVVNVELPSIYCLKSLNAYVLPKYLLITNLYI